MARNSRSRNAEEIVVDLLSGNGSDNPYQYYAELREVAPVHFSETLQACLVSRYEGVRQALTDRTFLVENRFAVVRADWREHPAFTLLEPTLFMMSPSDHARLSGVLRPSFSAARMEELRPQIASIAERCVNDLVAQGKPVDFVEHFAMPLPAAVIAELLGVPQLATRMSAAVQRWIPALEPGVSDEALLAADDAARDLQDLVAEVVDAHLFSMINMHAVSREELVGATAMLFVAGFNTVKDFLCNSLVALAAFPAQIDVLLDPETRSAAVAELLRFDAPVQLRHRVASRDVVIDGVLVKVGTAVLALQGSANRDGDVFPDPDRLDLRRSPNEHLTFGGGGFHHCLGAALASLEGEIAFEALFTRLPHVRPTANRTRTPGFVVRGFQTCEIVF